MAAARNILGIAAIAVAAPAGAAAAMTNGDGPRAMAPARDGNIAIREELDLARRTNTVAAYDMFIARHPKHPLVEVARKERRRLLRRVPRP